MQRRQATLEAVGTGVAVKPDGDPNRKRVADQGREVSCQEIPLFLRRT
jgi:hypothetical protein